VNVPALSTEFEVATRYSREADPLHQRYARRA
jgi:hypothetical protein